MMARLSLSFLGGFEVTFDAEPVTAFGTDKVRALLAFLAIDSTRPHRRAKLAAMFWPELPEKTASHNLSQSLLRLRRALREKDDPGRPPFLLMTPKDVQFNICSDCMFDVARFRELLNLASHHQHPGAADSGTTYCGICMQWFAQAAELYRGDLLSGLFVPDSIAFEEWRLGEQEELHRQAIETLTLLASYHEQRGEWALVIEDANRQIGLEPWREEAFMQLIRALANRGQTAAALEQFAIYKQRLEDELGIQPSAEANLLYDQLRSNGALPAATPGQPGSGETVWLASQGERRQVTTLVCGRDLQGDPEEIQEQMAGCERHCERIFQRFGGWRAQRMGNECLVFFGYPHAYEDAARRAVHSGLAVATEAEDDEPVRIGIHTGVLTVGEKRGRRWQDRDLIGTAIDIARNCQHMAEQGKVVISSNTRQLVQEFFDLQPVENQAHRAQGRQVLFYRVSGEGHAQSRLEWLAHTQRLTAYTSREAELNQVRACHENLINGSGQVVLLRGEPGIGKSRLIWELQNRLPSGTSTSNDHFQDLWLSSRCLPYYQNTSLYPLIGLLEQYLNFSANDSMEVRREKLTAALARHGLDRPSAIWLLSLVLGLPTGEQLPETITETQRNQISKIAITLLQKQATTQPLVLVIEDLHWSDPSTVLWLGEAIDSLAAVPCLTLLTARPGFHPAWLAEHDGQDNLLLISLQPLPPEQMEVMVMDLAGERSLAGDLRQRIIAQADGNPLFVEELTKALLERPALLEAKRLSTEIPATLQDSLASRLDHLGLAKETAQWAAVIGREFSYPVLHACAPYDEQRLQSDLASLLQAELVAPIEAAPQDVLPYITAGKRPATERYTFKHTLVQEAAYASLLKRTRQVYHQHVAETLEKRFPLFSDKRPEILASHYAFAGMPSQAADFWLRAGEQATAQGAFLEARTFFDRALAEIESWDTERLWRVLVGRETALFYHGDRAAQKADIDALLELAETFHDDLRCAQSHIRRARYSTSLADYRDQLAAAEAAAAAAARAGALAVEMEALAYKVTALLRLGERALLPQTVEQMLAKVQTVGDDHSQAYAMAAAALYYLETGDLARAAQLLNQSLAAAQRTGVRHFDFETQYYGHLGFTYTQLGLYSQARDALETGLELANRLGIGRYQAYHLVNLGLINWRIGNLQTAHQMVEQALQEYLATGEAFGQAVCQSYLGSIYEAERDYVQASECMARASAGFAELGVDPDHYEAQAAVGRLALARGQLEEARQIITEVWDYLREQGNEGLGSPAWIYGCIASVLDEIEIPAISQSQVIEAGYNDLMQRAEKISDAGWRRSFLENVAENREIVERWKNINQVSTGFLSD